MNFRKHFTKLKLNAYRIMGNHRTGRIKTAIRRQTPNAEIYVERLKKRIFRYIPGRYIPADSFERDRGGLPWYVLGLDLKGNLWPINVQEEVIENESPADFFMAKHCAEEVEEVYGLSMPLSEKIKLGIFIAIIFGIIIVIFMIVMSISGQNPMGP